MANTLTASAVIALYSKETCYQLKLVTLHQLQSLLNSLPKGGVNLSLSIRACCLYSVANVLTSINKVHFFCRPKKEQSSLHPENAIAFAATMSLSLPMFLFLFPSSVPASSSDFEGG